MRIVRLEEPFRPVSLVFESQKELLSIETALNISLHHWHKEEDQGIINSHIENVEYALSILRKSW